MAATAAGAIAVVVGLLLAGPAAAQTLASPGLPTAPIGRMRLSFNIVPAPVGSYTTNILGPESSSSTAFAFGLRPVFDYSLNDYFFVGFGPQLTFNVKPSYADGAAKMLDLMVRVGGHAPIADVIHLYGYLAPGYSILFLPEGDENAAGFALGVAGGAMYSFAGNLFANAELGYQLGYQEVSVGDLDIDARVNFLMVALGLGIKL